MVTTQHITMSDDVDSAYEVGIDALVHQVFTYLMGRVLRLVFRSVSNSQQVDVVFRMKLP